MSVFTFEQMLNPSHHFFSILYWKNFKSFSSLLFYIILEELINAVRLVKEIKGLQIEEEEIQLF